VRARDVRLSEAASERAPKRIKFASGVANIPPGETGTVRLRPTRQGNTIIRTSGKTRLRGVMEIRNTAGIVTSTTRIPIRLRPR
jgi:hypothetical protein